MMWKSNSHRLRWGKSLSWQEICRRAARDHRDFQPLSKPHGLSIAIRHLDCGSCGACELELTAVFDAPYLAERFGLYLVASPREADLLAVTGVLNKNMFEAAQATYQAMPEGGGSSRMVALIGDCAVHGGPLEHSPERIPGQYDSIWGNGESRKFIIPGCPPSAAFIIANLAAQISQ